MSTIDRESIWSAYFRGEVDFTEAAAPAASLFPSSPVSDLSPDPKSGTSIRPVAGLTEGASTWASLQRLGRGFAESRKAVASAGEESVSEVMGAISGFS